MIAILVCFGVIVLALSPLIIALASESFAKRESRCLRLLLVRTHGAEVVIPEGYYVHIEFPSGTQVTIKNRGRRSLPMPKDDPIPSDPDLMYDAGWMTRR